MTRRAEKPKKKKELGPETDRMIVTRRRPGRVVRLAALLTNSGYFLIRVVYGHCIIRWAANFEIFLDGSRSRQIWEPLV